MQNCAKGITLVLVVVSSLIAACQPVVTPRAAAVPIHWRTLEQARVEAKAVHKPVIVDFFTHQECPRCLTLMDQVYSDPQISKKVVDNFIPVRVYVTKPLSPAETALSAKLNNNGECILSFLTADGEIMTDENGKQIGSMEMLYPAVFEKLLERALSNEASRVRKE